MNDQKKNEILAVMLIAAGIFVLLSILTANSNDLGIYTSSPNPAPVNMTGIIGVYLSGVMLFTVGKAAYVFPLLLFVWGGSRLLQFRSKRIFYKLFGTVSLVTAVSSILSMSASTSSTVSFENGGVIGSVVSSFLLKYLGQIGSLVFILAIVALSLLIATEFLILPMILALSKLFVKIPEFLLRVPAAAAQKMAERKKARKTKLQEAKEEIARKLEAMKKQVEDARKNTRAAARGEVAAEPKKNILENISSGIKKSKDRKPRKPEKERVTSIQDKESGAYIDYKLPGLHLLKDYDKDKVADKDEGLKSKASILERTLLEFGVSAKVVKINKGPVITMYELEPSIGTKVNKITNLGDNISLAMKSANIRIVAPLPGKGTIGIEVPNKKSELVSLKEILESDEYSEEESQLKLALGKDISGEPIVLDLAAMPHLLIAGATGSGKTVCINCIITSLLTNSSPNELKLLMVDPKRVELMMFEGIPHLVSPIITNPKKVAASLEWLISEMERRYEMFAEKGVRNITSYKARSDGTWENLPFIVIIIDELADLMAVAQQDIEGSIMRLAQLSRAAGIHIILATQRPSVNVITGVIKANFPARISFKVAQKVDSRTVLDANGAEKLLGRGDMLVMEPGRSDLLRGQCSLVEDSEIRGIVKFIKEQSGPQYMEDAIDKQMNKSSGDLGEKDDLYEDAVNIVLETGQASVSMVQRRLRVGYTRAARMIDFMEQEGIVGPYNGSKAREILIESIEDIRTE